MKYEELKQLIIRKSKDRDGMLTISCRQCHQIATKYKVSLIVIGRLCQKENIKITDCQLGCFGRWKRHYE